MCALPHWALVMQAIFSLFSLYMHFLLLAFHYSHADEDIPTLVPPSPLNDDQTIAAKKVPSDDIKIGPITRAHAKLLEQQVNLFLVEPNLFINENFMLPKSWCVCVLRFEEEGIVRGGEELHHLVTKEEFMQEAAMEERETGTNTCCCIKYHQGKRHIGLRET
jgi:hypothetical protein